SDTQATGHSRTSERSPRSHPIQSRYHRQSRFTCPAQPLLLHQTIPGPAVSRDSSLDAVVNTHYPQHEQNNGDAAGNTETDSLRDEVTKTNRPRIQKHNLDVEDDKNHRDEVELHRVPLASGTDWIHTTFVSRGF